MTLVCIGLGYNGYKFSERVPESCGKCYPCRLETQRQLKIMERVVGGRAGRGDLVAPEDIEFAMRETCLCGLGMAAGTAIISAYQRWPHVFRGGEV